jgi:arylsulfatase A-like enzyme
MFPFRDWIPWKQWPVPGWNPVSETDDTLAEILQERGYRTGFITDVYHLFKPGMNLHRGFDEWRWIRGQEFDCYASGSTKAVDSEQYMNPKMNRTANSVKMFSRYLRNTRSRQKEEDYFAPMVFRSAARWLEENYRCEKFFLCIDCFDPHEPWDPPQHYVDIYDPGYQGVEIILPTYTDNLDYLSDAELRHIRALYAGEVTLVDTWLGFFVDKVRQLNLMEDTIITLISDHGHIIGERRCMGKVASGLFSELMDLVFFIKCPGQSAKIIDTFVYDHDLFSTVFYLLNETIPGQSEGENLWELVEGKKTAFRDYVTSIFRDHVYLRDEHHMFISHTSGSDPQLYDLKQDPGEERNIAQQNRTLVKRMYDRILQDAGGSIPNYDITWRVW